MNSEQEINRSLSLKDTWDGSWPATRAVPLSFFGAPLVDDLDTLDADVAFIGVPYDQGTFARAGARYGPDGIRYARDVYGYDSIRNEKTAQGYFDIDRQQTFLKGVTMADCGDVTIIPADVENNFAKITHAVRKIIAKGSFPVIVGGDHSITFPAARGFDSYSELDVVHFDAHMDFSHETQASFYHHGCPIRRCFDLPNVRNVTSIGIRKATKPVYDDAISKGVKVVTTEQFRAMGPEGAVAHVPAGGNVYLTVDVDVMDPMQVPGTGSPAPGGFFYYEMRDALIALSKRVNIVGCDFVEVAPPYDHAETSTMCTAKLILDLLAELFPSR